MKKIIRCILLSLVVGIICGHYGSNNYNILFFSELSNIVLVVLMISVGISVGMNKHVFQKMKTYHFKILIIPIAIISCSLVGGIVCAIILKMPINESLAIVSGLGWYSLSGVLLTEIANAEIGSIAFMANLMREIFAIMLVPVIAKYFNYYAAIAPAAATSEDTTLPILIKYTNEEVVMMAVINGVICSAMVPILVNTTYYLFKS
ncbi:MAG: lysine exporter LysO family protein [Cellulosilyticaceae bacterium]